MLLAALSQYCCGACLRNISNVQNCRAGYMTMTRHPAACRMQPCICARHATILTCSWTPAITLQTPRSSFEHLGSWSCWIASCPCCKPQVGTCLLCIFLEGANINSASLDSSNILVSSCTHMSMTNNDINWQLLGFVMLCCMADNSYQLASQVTS